MIDGRDILSGICGAVIVFVLFFLIICIGAVANKQSIREQVTDWFGVQAVEELPATDDTANDNVDTDTNDSDTNVEA